MARARGGGAPRKQAAPTRSASRRQPGRVSRLTAGDHELLVITAPRRPRPRPALGLTPAERHVYERVVAGWSARRIAEERGVSERTVINQRQSIYRKLGVANAAALRALAREEI